MICEIHQPNFFPWLGYFNKIQSADVFVVLDDVQFTKGTWINRVKLDLGGEAKWLTCPVGARSEDRINQVLIDDSRGWRRKALRTVETNYVRAPHFNKVFPELGEWFERHTTNLAEFNISAIKEISKMLSLNTKFVLQSELKTTESSNGLLIEICKKVGANTYLAGSGAGGYQQDSLFEAAGIKVQYQSYAPKPYRENFLSGLSIIDALMWRGFDAEFLKSAGEV